MILMPPKVVKEKFLKPNGLSEDLIKQIRIESYQGPGERNPWYWQNDVERFVEAHRPKSFEKKSYGEEEGFDVIAIGNAELRKTGPLLKLKQAAQYLAIGERQLQYEVERGNIGYVRLGKKCLRFSQLDLDDYVDQHRTAPQAVRGI